MEISLPIISITTLSIKSSFATLGINDSQYKMLRVKFYLIVNFIMLSAIMLSVVILSVITPIVVLLSVSA